MAFAVNAAIELAAKANGSQVRVLDMHEIFTPGGRYRASMPVDGGVRTVRHADGRHLSTVYRAIERSQTTASGALEPVRS